MPTITRYRSLMPHQKAALAYCLRTRNPALLMEMRTGKTLVIIRWVKALGLKAVLVLAPLTVLEAWETELRREKEPFLTCYGLTREEREERLAEAWFTRKRRTWVLMNYDALLAAGERVRVRGRWRRQPPDFAYLPWDVVIADESVRAKNPQAQITQVCLKGFRDARHRAILTGLPNPESNLELFCQFAFLSGTFIDYRSYWDFRVKCFQKRDRFNWVPKPGQRRRIKEYVHERAFVLTATQAGMPSQTQYQVRRVDMTAKQKRLYKQVERDYAINLLSGKQLQTKWVLTKQVWLQRLAGGFDPEENLVSGAKATELVELLSGELAGKKCVVWFKFRSELEYCRERLRKAKISAVSIMGGESLESRRQKLREFRGRTVRVLLGMEKCAKYGIDCSVADTAIYYSNEWSNDDRSQSIKRVVHPLKKRVHLIIDLVTRGTLDEDAVKALQDKSINSRIFMARMEDTIRRRYVHGGTG